MLDSGRWWVLALAAAGIVGGVVVGAAVGTDLGSRQTLVVEDYEDGEELLAVPVEENSTVVVAYTHSVEKTPVRDIYAVRGGELVMTRMEFHSFGAGLPAQADVERGENGSFVYRPPDRREETLVVATGEIAGHELIVDERRYDLVDLADGESVRIRVRNRFGI